jgi:hypothetical protein
LQIEVQSFKTTATVKKEMLILTKEIGAGCETQDKGAIYQGVWFLGAHIYAYSRSITYGALRVRYLKTRGWRRSCGRGQAIFRFVFRFSRVLGEWKRFNECIGILRSTFARSLSHFWNILPRLGVPAESIESISSISLNGALFSFTL